MILKVEVGPGDLVVGVKPSGSLPQNLPVATSSDAVNLGYALSIRKWRLVSVVTVDEETHTKELWFQKD